MFTDSQTHLYLSEFNNDLDNVVQNAINNAKKAVIWGANLICLELLNDYELPSSSIIVDSPPAKYN